MIFLAFMLPGVLIVFAVTHSVMGPRLTLARGFVIFFGGWFVSTLLLMLLLFVAEIWTGGH